MIPFLYNVANAYYKEYGQKVSRYTFVFPNRRAGIFFQHYLAKIAGKPIFSPEILTISDLFEKLSPYKKADRIEMLFMLYTIYTKISRTSESFDDFLHWGEMLLNDFDDVDKYLADAKQIFSNIYDLREIDAEFSYLTPTQVEAIRRFWSNFLPVGDNEKKKDFLELWKVLFDMYTQLRECLMAKNLAYEGMIFRDITERAILEDNWELKTERIVFVGLNGQSKSEEKFLKYLHKKGVADFYWDYSSPLVSDPANKASFFMDKNKWQFPSLLTLEPDEPASEKPILEVIGIPSAVGQAKYTHTIISQLLKEKLLTSAEQAMNTAIVLPDENLLLPTLYSIPEEMDKINVTMGYSLKNSSISGLMAHIFELQKNIRSSANYEGFYFRPVLAILNHRYITTIAPEESKMMRSSILKFNRVIVPLSELQAHTLFKKIFKPIADWRHIPQYLKDILSLLNTLLFVKERNKEEDKDKEVAVNSRAVDIETEFIVEYYKTINKMEEAVKYASPDMTVQTYVKLLKRLISSVAIPFTGEPLSGLQIMGVLETRALDFENLIILSMNEGVFPFKKATNSFIPYNIRQGFELPTYEHQDSIFAYHFYRMTHRAKRIYLVYDTRTEGIQSGEVSRFYNQIKHLYADQFQIQEKLAVYTVTSNESLDITIKKTPHIMNKMKQFLSGGGKSLSASSINTYLDCPLQFYLSVIEGMTPEDEISETIEASTFGTIFHDIIDSIYKPFEGRLVTSEALRKIRKDDEYLTSYIEKSFAKHYFKVEKVRKLTGQNYLTGEILRKYLKKLLDTDIQIAPFIYIESEKKIQLDYPLPNGQQVSLKSFIDRVDELNGRTRIIDYKSGKGALVYRDMFDLFDKNLRERPKAVMQVFMYALLYELVVPNKIIEPGIYYLRNLFDSKFDPNVIYKPEREDKRVVDFSLYKNQFKNHFDTCIEEIFDPNIPFIQTPTGNACKWCTFTNICKK